MEIKVKINTVTITDDTTGKTYKVKTVRTAGEIAGYIDESEKDEAISVLENAVYEAIAKK